MTWRSDDPVYRYRAFLGIAGLLEGQNPERAMKLIERADLEVEDRVPPDVLAEGRVRRISVAARVGATPAPVVMAELDSILERSGHLKLVTLEALKVRIDLAGRLGDATLLARDLYSAVTILAKVRTDISHHGLKARRSLPPEIASRLTARIGSGGEPPQSVAALLSILSGAARQKEKGQTLAQLVAWVSGLADVESTLLISRERDRSALVLSATRKAALQLLEPGVLQAVERGAAFAEGAVEVLPVECSGKVCGAFVIGRHKGRASPLSVDEGHGELLRTALTLSGIILSSL